MFDRILVLILACLSLYVSITNALSIKKYVRKIREENDHHDN